MKKCPKCSFAYYDNTLDFCLEDGTRLEVVSDNQPTATIPRPASTAEKTLFIPNTAAEIETVQRSNLAPTIEVKELDKSPDVSEKKIYKMLEIAPVVVALTHNWWQWVYLEGQSYSSFTNYVFSGNFLGWLFLLLVGTLLSVLSLRNSRDKKFAIISLSILAINLLLFIVPRK